MTTETTAPTTGETISTDTMGDVASRFDEQVKAEAAQQAPAPAATPAKAPETQAKPATEDSDIPEHLLGGEKPAPKAKEPTELEKVLAQEEPVRGKGHWKLVKEHALQLESELAARTKELNEIRAQTPKADRTEIDAEIKQHREQVEKLQAELERAAFERSPRYQAFLDREKGNLDAAKGYLDGGEINPDVVDLAANAKPAQRLKMLKEAGADAETIAAIMPYLAQNDAVRAEREKSLASHKEISAQEAAQQAVQAQQREQQEREQQMGVFREVADSVKARYAPFQKQDGEEFAKWNASVDETFKRAEEIYLGGLSDKDVAEAAYKAAAFEKLHGLYTRVFERNKALNEQVKKLSAQQPDGGAARRDGAQTIDPNRPFSYEDAGARFEAELGRNGS